ncbi:MAG: zinc-ribbon domain containing protein [Planctomycetota bacterium]
MSKRREKREKAEHIREHGPSLPEGAIEADLSAQAPNNSYDPPTFYVDQPFTCCDCGKEEVWLAADQKWYYEVVKGPIYGRASRCRPCRKRRRLEKEARDAERGSARDRG